MLCSRVSGLVQALLEGSWIGRVFTRVSAIYTPK